MRQMLLQNAAAILLQNATVLLQNSTVVTNCDKFITKCDVYYKLRWYNFEHVIAGWGVISSEKFVHTTQ